MKPALPAGYQSYVVGTALVVTRPEYFPFVRDAVHAHDSLYAYAASRRDADRLTGRVPAYAIAGPGGGWVIRRYHRGGAVARVLGDRYARVGQPRPLRELAASAAARERGIATPEVLAAALYRSAVFTRSELATRHLAGGRDLVAVLFDGGTADEQLDAFTAAGATIRQLGAAGVLHRDLNLKNLLYTPGAGPRIWVLDLDRCRVTASPRAISARPMLRRLQRSIEKLERLRGRTVDRRVKDALEAGFRG